MASRTLRWLEVSADYRCNNRCVGCYSVSDDGPSMTSREVSRELYQARRRGATLLWLGGGEPTLRTDLVGIVEKARAFGYARVKLQTNGMRLSYPEYTARLVRAGVTEVNFSIKGATAETHDRLTQTPGCHELMLAGISQVAAHGLRMEGDLLLYRSNLHELPEMVQRYFALGLTRFNVWQLSTADDAAAELRDEVPRYTELVSALLQASDLGLSTEPDFITSLHTPPCTVPESHHRMLFRAADLDLWVANPGDSGFFLEESPIEGGVFLAGCADCRFRASCGGTRRDYLRIFGDDEIRPVI